MLTTLFLVLTIHTTDGICQKGSDRYFGEPMLTDSLTTLFIPTRYDEEFLSSNKIAYWGGYYANIVAYNFQTDTYRKIFGNDTFIELLQGNDYRYGTRNKLKNITRNWIFLLVKIKDTNNNGRIDEKDPSVLFAVSPNGQTLKQLTNETENIVSFENFENQGFILIKIQRDADNDKSFKNDDKEFYFRKVSLTDLSLGKEITIK